MSVVFVKKECMYLFWEYQSCLHKTKEQALEQMPAGNPIEISEKPILGEFERFCDRLNKVVSHF